MPHPHRLLSLAPTACALASPSRHQLQRRALLSLAAAVGTTALMPAVGQAQGTSGGDFPNKPLRMVLGFSPGGSGDQLARIVNARASELLGQQIVIEYKPGAATNIASEFVSKAPPDGYTLLLGGNFSHAVNPHLFRRLPFDPVKDFSPVLQVTNGEAQLLCVPANLPVANMAEFLVWARREGDKVNFGSSGPGSPGHIAGAYFAQKAGLQMTHVPYKGSSEAVRDLVGGQIQMAIVSTTTAMPLVRDGRLKALMQTTAQRSRFVAEVPSASEAGLADFDIAGWYGIWAPAGVPAPVLNRLNQAFNGSLADAATRQRMDVASLTAAGGSAEAFGRFVQTEIRRWEPIVRASGASL